MIHFYSTIVNRALEIVKEAHDSADVLLDLNQIEQAKANLYYGGVFAADQLDQKLRRKYPTIDKMLALANTMLPPSPQVSKIRSDEDRLMSNLTQDYFGILCDTAVKKGLTQSIKDCIESVD